MAEQEAFSNVTIDAPSPGWYLPIAGHLRSAYLRYAFTYGTSQEVEFLMRELELEPGMRLLDVGAGPGRHSVEFARRGLDVVAVDLSEDFAGIARQRASEAGVVISVFAMDAADMPFEEEFDAVLSLCEGGFGLAGDDLKILRSMSVALRPGGRLALGAPNVFYVLAHMGDSGEFDPVRMVFKETVPVIGENEETRDFELWNSCYTPRELEWMANGAGLVALGVVGIVPGGYERQAPSRDHPELLLLASKPQVEN